MTEQMPADQPFGVELRRRRSAAGLSLQNLALSSHYSKGHISKVEAGLKPPSPDFARRVDAVLGANGQLLAMALKLAETRRASGAQQHSLDVTWPLAIGHLDVGKDLLTGVGNERAALAHIISRAPTPGIDQDALLDTFRAILQNMRELGQVLDPWSMMPMLTSQTVVLRELASRVNPSATREAMCLAARFAEYTGWMAQETGDNLSARRWTDLAVQLAREAGDQDLVAYAYVRYANMALYQQDAFGVISLARQVQEMDCSNRVRGLATLREAQGHALAGDEPSFRRCIQLSADLFSRAGGGDSEVLILGSTKIPDAVALAEGWSLYDLGQSAMAIEILSSLLERVPKGAKRAWARVGARLALALASIREIERCCELLYPILNLAPAVQSATIRSDLRDLARVLNRWRLDPEVQRVMPMLSSALATRELEAPMLMHHESWM